MWAAKTDTVQADGENITFKGILSVEHLVAQPHICSDNEVVFLLWKVS